jgi:tetratricopeptide (TPR) repeat protein
MGLFGFMAPKTYLETAENLYRSEHYAEAIPNYVRAIELNQRPAISALKLGLCYQFTNRFADAERAYALVVRLNPANVDGWKMCSIVQTFQGKFGEAKASAKQGLSYIVANDQELDCHFAFLQALAVQIESIGYHRCVGVVQVRDYCPELDSFRSDRIELVGEACPVLLRCLELAPRNPDVHRFHVLIAIYDYHPNDWVTHMSALQQVSPPLFEQLKGEFQRCYSRAMPMRNET